MAHLSVQLLDENIINADHLIRVRIAFSELVFVLQRSSSLGYLSVRSFPYGDPRRTPSEVFHETRSVCCDNEFSVIETEGNNR